MARVQPSGGRAVPTGADEGEKRTSLVDDAYAAMRAAIRDASFAPGYQASEQEIALRLGMSRTPVHEAAIRLQEDGLVRVLPRKGILILALAPDDMREIYDVIIAMEGRAAELVAALPEGERLAAAQALDAHTDTMADAHARGDLPAWGRGRRGVSRRADRACPERADEPDRPGDQRPVAPGADADAQSAPGAGCLDRPSIGGSPAQFGRAMPSRRSMPRASTASARGTSCCRC